MVETKTTTTVNFTAAEFLHLVRDKVFGGKNVNIQYVIREVDADPMGMYPGRNDVVGVSVSYDGPPVA